jgi:hypothetical protein
MKKISSWPKVLAAFSNTHFSSEPSGNSLLGLTSQPASLQLLHALSDSNSQKIAAKIHHNVLIAAAHIAYIKEHHVDGDHLSDNHLPDRKKSSMSFQVDDIYFLLKWPFEIAHAPRRSTHVTTNNLDLFLDAEKRNSDGKVESKMATFRKPRKSKTKHTKVIGEEDTDKEDLTFAITSESSSDEISVNIFHLASVLPSKSAPTTVRGS